MDYDEVIETIIMEGVDQDIVNERHESFDAKFLTKVSHIWQYFIYSSLMPTTRYSTMQKNELFYYMSLYPPS